MSCNSNPCWPCPPSPSDCDCKDGKSAFDIWRENQPTGADISLEAYLASMKGTAGVGITDITVTTEPVTEETP